jgi:hypothetical protein
MTDRVLADVLCEWYKENASGKSIARAQQNIPLLSEIIFHGIGF